MKKIILAAFVMLTFVTPSFAFDFTAEYGLGVMDSIVLRTPLSEDLSLNFGMDYKSVNLVNEVSGYNNSSKMSIIGSIYMPLFGLDYKMYSKEALSVSLGTNILFVIPDAYVELDNDDEENATNDFIDDNLKNFSSMVLDVYARTNYTVTNDFNVFGTFGFKGVGITLDPDGDKNGLGLNSLYTKVGIAFDFSI